MMMGESKIWGERVRAMLLHLRQSERGCLLIAAADDRRLEEGVAALLREDLEGQILLREHIVEATYPSLAAYLSTLGPSQGREAVLVHGLAELVEEARLRAFDYLNAEREALRLAGRSLVLFVTPDILPELIHRAPDFWSWRSSVFEFCAPSDEAAKERELAALRLSFGGTDLAKLRERYLQYLVSRYKWLDFRGLLQVRNIVRLPLDQVYIPLSATAEVGAKEHIRKAVQGDAEAFGALYSLYLGPIYRYIYHRTANVTVAEDLTESAFLEAWRAIARYELEPSSFSSWLYRIAREIVVDYYRTRGEDLSLRRDRLTLGGEEDLGGGELISRKEELALLGTEPFVVGRPVELKHALAEYERLVLLGDPGSGKTTLLRYLALNLAQGGAGLEEKLGLDAGWLPIPLPIAAYAEARREEGDLALADYLPRYFMGHGVPDMGPLLSGELEGGRCLVMLDGLDEVLEASERREIVGRVADFVRQYEGNRFVVTSRIAGYRHAALDDRFVHLTVSEFGDEEIKRFVQQWCYAYETMDGETEEAKRRAHDRTEALLEAIDSEPAVRRLAVNPLLLTILALIHYQGVRLPHRRVELYRLCVEALAETWNLARSLSGRPIDLWLGPRRLDERYVVELLAPIAFWMHEEKPGGVVSRKELEGGLANHLEQREGASSEKAKNLAHDFVNLVCEQSGLLVERGLDQFAFMHLTFEEYLAARHLSEKMDVAELVRLRLHNPRWREPILLTAGILRGEHADHLVKSIYEAGSPYEDVLHRDLLMAARCLADDVQVELALRHSILEHLLALWRTSTFGRLVQETTATVAAMRGTANEGQVLTRVLLALRDEEGDVLRKAAGALEQLGADRPEVIDKLLEALRDREGRVRGSAAWALGQLGVERPDVVDKLLEALRDKEGDVRGSAAWALGQLGVDRPEVIDKLLEALRDKEAHVRYRAAEALGQLGADRPDVIDKLLEALRDKEGDVRDGAAWALGQLGADRPDVIDKLLEALSDKEWDVRYRAAGALGQLGTDRPDVIDKLLEALRDRDRYVRAMAAEALGRLGVDRPDVIDKLLEALSDKEGDVRGRAAGALGELGADRPDVIDKLLGALRDKEEDVRDGATGALGQLGVDRPDVIDKLLEALRDKEGDVRYRAAGALGQLGADRPDVIDKLLEALRDKEGDVRGSAAWALGQLGADRPEVIDKLLEALGDKEGDVRGSAAGALGQLGADRPEVIDRLLPALRDEWIFVRGKAAEALGQLGADRPEVIDKLLPALRDEERFVRGKAAEALGQLGQGKRNVMDALAAGVRSEGGGLIIGVRGMFGIEVVHARNVMFEGLWRLAESSMH